jgi:molecular chaperone DnaK (HSP70)
MIIHKFTDEKKHTFQVEIQETYKIQDFSSQYIGKIIHIDHQNITKNILMVVTVPNNFTLQK